MLCITYLFLILLWKIFIEKCINKKFAIINSLQKFLNKSWVFFLIDIYFSKMQTLSCHYLIEQVIPQKKSFHLQLMIRKLCQVTSHVETTLGFESMARKECPLKGKHIFTDQMPASVWIVFIFHHLNFHNRSKRSHPIN